MTQSVFHWGAVRPVLKDGRVVRLAPFSADPNPSQLIEGTLAGLYADLRVLQPMIRTSWLKRTTGTDHRLGRGRDEFAAVDWPTALGLASEAIRRTIDRYGNQAIYAGSYGWASAGRFHHAPSLLHRFFNTLGGSVQHQQTYSYAAVQVVCPHVIGTNDIISGGSSTTWPSIITYTERLFLFGGLNQKKNAQVSAGGLLTHETTRYATVAAKKPGFRIYSISPIRDDTPDLPNTVWVPIRPGTDTALMLGIAYILIKRHKTDAQFLAQYTVGYERLRDYVEGTNGSPAKTPDWASKITGVSVDLINDLAMQMADHRTLLSSAWALQRADHGEQPYWMMIALACLLGQIGLPGGGVCFGYGSMGNRGVPRSPYGSPRMEEGTNRVGLRIPVARVADMLLEPGATIPFDGGEIRYPDIHMVYWAGGNPFHHHQDLNRLVKAFFVPETVIVNEPYWTATARRADIVFPVTTALERNDITASTMDNHLMAIKRQIAPVGESRNDFDIFRGLAQRLGVESLFTEGLEEMGWLNRLYAEVADRCSRAGHPLPAFEEFWARGTLELPQAQQYHDLFADFRADPRTHALETPSGRIELWSQTIADFSLSGLPPHPAWLEPCEWLGNAQADELHLVSNQPATRLHSQLDAFGASASSKIHDREPLRIHPADAKARGIRDGQVVRVYNERGACLAGAVIDDGLMQGVVQLSTGAWYEPRTPGVPGSLDVHGNPNVLTPNRPSSLLTQAPTPGSTLVKVEVFVGELPPVQIHRPPKGSCKHHL